MIKILFPEGCYGTYLARCVYTYTNLNTTPLDNVLNFDSAGSSHTFRDNLDASTKIWRGHLLSPDWCVNDGDKIITVLPHPQHYLDYFNNQFDKSYEKEIVRYMLMMLTEQSIKEKLKNHWKYNGPFNSEVPRWILREFFSYWIMDCFNNGGYSYKNYQAIPNKLIIDTQDIILNFETTFDKICQVLDLTKIVDDKILKQNHENFLLAQQYRDSQLKCEEWVNLVVEGNEALSPCQTIFDEAYIQYLLRTLGYEIKCDGLNNFPLSTLEMAPLIYANSHNHN